MMLIYNESPIIYINTFTFIWIIVIVLFLLFLFTKIMEKIIKLISYKSFIKLKFLNDKYLGFILFSFLSMAINLYMLLSYMVSDSTNTNVYGSPELILIINISFLLKEIVIDGFKINLNLIVNKDFVKYLRWIRTYIISAITLILDLIIRSILYVFIPKLLILINYFMSINFNTTIDISSSVLFFKFALTILLYLCGKYICKSNFLFKLKYVSLNSYYKESIDNLVTRKN